MPKCSRKQWIDRLYAGGRPGGLVSGMGLGPAEAVGMLTLHRQKLQQMALG